MDFGKEDQPVVVKGPDVKPMEDQPPALDSERTADTIIGRVSEQYQHRRTSFVLEVPGEKTGSDRADGLGDFSQETKVEREEAVVDHQTRVETDVRQSTYRNRTVYDKTEVKPNRRWVRVAFVAAAVLIVGFVLGKLAIWGFNSGSTQSSAQAKTASSAPVEKPFVPRITAEDEAAKAEFERLQTAINEQRAANERNQAVAIEEAKKTLQVEQAHGQTIQNFRDELRLKAARPRSVNDDGATPARRDKQTSRNSLTLVPIQVLILRKDPTQTRFEPIQVLTSNLTEPNREPIRVLKTNGR